MQLHKQQGAGAGSSSSSSESHGDGSAEEGIRDLALMEALLQSAQQDGAPVKVQAVL